jgi:hypothetical protein
MIGSIDTIREPAHANLSYPPQLSLRGREIAGNWPPAWVAYLAGSLKAAGFDDIHFIDAMTNMTSRGQLRVKLAEMQPDVVGTTAITPSIYVAEETLAGRQGGAARRVTSSAASTPPSCTSRS